jgi:hypothetical protein
MAWRRPVSALSLACVMLATHGAAERLQDRPAYEINPQGAPVWLDEPIFFENGPMLSVSVRNRENDTAFVTLGVYAFDADGRLRATSTLCLGDPLGGTSRRRVNRPLEFRGVTTRDRVVVTVLRVVTERGVWALRGSDNLAQAARRRASGSGGRLTMTRTAASGLPQSICPCETSAVETRCRDVCEGSLTAYTCSPWFPGCTTSCTCNP